MADNPDRSDLAPAALLAEIERLQAELLEAKWQIAELEARADVDPLTDVLNRRGFDRELARALSYVKRYGGRAALVLIDLDGFKAVNDRFGHATGDAVLVTVAKRLRASVRDVDFACRPGGDEFVVLLPDITDEEAASVARRIISRVSEPLEFAPAARIGASIGISAAPRDGTTADELLSAADLAMYEAKRRGKGGFVMHAPHVEAESLAPLAEADSGFAAVGA